MNRSYVGTPEMAVGCWLFQTPRRGITSARTRKLLRSLPVGGTRRCGRLVIDELLGRGTPTDLADVRAAFKADKPAVVIVALNASRASDSPFANPISPPRLMADSNANVVAAIKEFRAFRVGDSWARIHCLLRLLMKTSNMSHQYDDHNDTEREVRASGVDYVFVRPSRLVETKETRVKVWPEDGKGVPMMASTSLISVACEEWNNSAPVITN
ncbi:TrkA-N domain dehydrogenase [Aspergillus sclerotioniger CBS 115572]|uniref:TrkA-N domain dehydrogenase n=1 Tax=Aspergillus sclerotioniger CBS 115572 TaxID=1450535 RepID=A0A317X038_9EURO|nr:TrkA-N domain dehydrogenase [Aspergillus sclerotioniger CBS 115572]PWY91531.1 TrkA-N domain dehydrogenase [Aspergillus sclerotioniger CBS 115572]